MKRSDSNKLNVYLPLILSFTFITALCAVIYFECISNTNGKFIYILDDAYIHLAYAKNIVINNVAGITQYADSSSSSSPLYSLILASIFFLSGVNELMLLFLNILFSLALLTLLFFIFRKYSFTTFLNTFSLFTVIIFTPLAINIFSGMEHLIQSVLVILFVFISAKELCKDETKSNKITGSDKYILILSFFLTAVRYEDLLVITIISGLFLFKKNYLKAFLIFICGILPVCIYGQISVNNGGFFIPNSLLVKLAVPESVSIFTEGNVYTGIINYLDINKKIILLFSACLIMFIITLRKKRNIMSEIPLLLFITISLILLHKLLFPVSVFRYDLYLVVLSITVIAIALNAQVTEISGKRMDLIYLKNSKIALSIIILFSIYLIYKISDTRKIIIASKNIYEQQYQMAQFLDTYYSGEEVALNDIGTINFFTDIQCTDLIGIGSNEVVSEKLKGNFNTNSLRKIA